MKKLTDEDYFNQAILGDNYHEKRELNIPYKKIASYLIIAVSAVLIVLGIFYSPKIFKSKDELGTLNFEYHSSLITGEIKNLPSNLEDSIMQAVKKGTKVSISFQVTNGNGEYTDEFIIGDTIQKITQTQDRVQYFRIQKSPELLSKIAAYNNALNAKPFRAIAIGIDVTEGYKEQFHFSDYLSPEDVAWLSDVNKTTELYVFSIGYNSVPGFLTWNQMKPIATMEAEIQAFLSPVKEALSQTALLSQIHYIFDKVGLYTSPTVVIKSDMLENTNDLSAYRKDNAYDEFVHQKIDSYQQKALASAGVTTLKPATTGDLKIILPRVSALGRDQKDRQWYSAIEYYLHRAYPGVSIKMTH